MRTIKKMDSRKNFGADPPTGGQDDPISIYMLDTEFSESFKDTIKENLQLF